MFDMSAVLSGTTTLVQTGFTLLDPSTYFGAVVTIALISVLLVKVTKKVFRLAR